MNDTPVLTIAVPTFNMERWLRKNLETYRDGRLEGRLEVLCLNNASEDGSKAIMEDFCQTSPGIFHLLDRDGRGYGSSINAAMAQARGQYFRIVDADDWVDTGELVKLVDMLESCEADVVLTDYRIVDMGSGVQTPVRAGEQGIAYHRLLSGFDGPKKTLPSIHGTTYRTELLRSSGFYMQDQMFFVDEEYVILPYLYAKSVIYFPFDVYRYQVANPAQSTSPKNRAKYREHREKVLRRLVGAYLEEKENPARAKDAVDYCHARISRGVGDHLTTLYMYVEDRAAGRRLAHEWQLWLMGLPDKSFYAETKSKADTLILLNRLHISLKTYNFLKKIRNVGGQKA